MSERLPSAAFVMVCLLLASCRGGSGAPTATPTIGPVEFADAYCEWQDELLLAVGNPDTGVDSQAWSAFETALSTEDADAIRADAQTVLDHLAAAEAWAHLMAAYPGAEEGGGHLRALMAGIAEGVTTLRDAAVSGDGAAAEAGRGTLQQAYQDHFWQGLDALREPIGRSGLVQGTPCEVDPDPET